MIPVSDHLPAAHNHIDPVDYVNGSWLRAGVSQFLKGTRYKVNTALARHRIGKTLLVLATKLHHNWQTLAKVLVYPAHSPNMCLQIRL